MSKLIKGSICISYAWRSDLEHSCGGGDDGAGGWCSRQDAEVKPSQIAVEIFGGDSAMTTQKVLKAFVAAVDRLNVEVAAHPLACGLVKRLVADTQRGGARWVAGAAIGDQQSVGVENRPKNGFNRGGADGWQHSADGGSGSVGGHQDGNLLVREPSFGGLAAALAGFAIKPPLAFAARQHKGLVGLDDAAQFDHAAAHRLQKSMPPAKGRAAGDAAAFGRGNHRLALAQRSANSVQRSLCRSRASGVPVKQLKVLLQPRQKYRRNPLAWPRMTAPCAAQ